MDRRLLLIAFASAAACEKPAAPATHVPGEDAACGDEVRVCEDGTPIGRVGPECAFAACPGPEDGAAFDPDGTQSDGQTSPPVPTEDADE